MLSQYCNENQTDWDVAIPYITFAYNTSVQQSTKYSPFELLYGKEATFPAEVALHKPTSGVPNVDEHFKQRSTYLKKARELAVKNIEASQERNARYYNKRHREADFKSGQLVLVHSPRRYKDRAEKFLKQWLGPYKILD